jgi:hypothetical protein
MFGHDHHTYVVELLFATFLFKQNLELISAINCGQNLITVKYTSMENRMIFGSIQLAIVILSIIFLSIFL